MFNLKFNIMKNTKQFFKVLIIFLLTYQMNGQIKFGVQFGLNATNISQSYSSDYRDFDFPTKSKFGFNLGVVAEYALNDQMGIQSGIMFTQKGYQVDWDAFLEREDSDGKVTGYWKTNYNYLEFPVHLYYNIDNLSIFAGPYMAYGLSGTSSIDATYKEDDYKDTLRQTDDLNAVMGAVKREDFMNLDDEVPVVKVFNALDYGLDIGAGYKYEQFLVRAQYSIGLSNLTPGISDYEEFDPNDIKKTNKGFNFSLIYFFNE